MDSIKWAIIIIRYEVDQRFNFLRDKRVTIKNKKEASFFSRRYKGNNSKIKTNHNQIFAHPQRFEPRRRYRSPGGPPWPSWGHSGSQQLHGWRSLQLATPIKQAGAPLHQVGPFLLESYSPLRASTALHQWSRPWSFCASSQPWAYELLSLAALYGKQRIRWWKNLEYLPLVLVEALKIAAILGSIEIIRPLSTMSFLFLVSTWALIQSVKMFFRTEAHTLPIHYFGVF